MEIFMKEAMLEARKAYALKETPIGAVVVYDGKVVGRGFNKIETTNDPTNHAEMVAIKDACKNLDRWRLFDCTLFVTMEPCFMCSGAIVNSRLKNIYVGVRHNKNHVVDKHNNFKLEFYKDYKVNVQFGLLEDECSNILTQFFREKRQSKK